MLFTESVLRFSSPDIAYPSYKLGLAKRARHPEHERVYSEFARYKRGFRAFTLNLPRNSKARQYTVAPSY